MSIILIAMIGLAGSTMAGADEIVVIVNTAAAAPTKSEVVDIYMGRSLAFTPVDLVITSPLFAEFYLKATSHDTAQIRANWSRLVFSARGQVPKSLPDAAAVKKAVASDPQTIGYIEKSAVDGTVKVAISLP